MFNVYNTETGLSERVAKIDPKIHRHVNTQEEFDVKSFDKKDLVA